jgi:hypothetical protein
MVKIYFVNAIHAMMLAYDTCDIAETHAGMLPAGVGHVVRMDRVLRTGP